MVVGTDSGGGGVWPAGMWERVRGGEVGVRALWQARW
jgi:hypothetical protein